MSILAAKTCPSLSHFDNLRSIRYVRVNRSTHLPEDAREPFWYDTRAYHRCEPGYQPYPTNLRFCHGRGGVGEETWTRPLVCTRELNFVCLATVIDIRRGFSTLLNVNENPKSTRSWASKHNLFACQRQILALLSYSFVGISCGNLFGRKFTVIDTVKYIIDFYIVCNVTLICTWINFTSPATCAKRDKQAMKEYELKCGASCITSKDCPRGKICSCDGACGRSCLKKRKRLFCLLKRCTDYYHSFLSAKGISCGEAPSIPHATIEYTGSGRDKVAHYLCDEGMYVTGGDVSKKCSGTGQWEGRSPRCERQLGIRWSVALLKCNQGLFCRCDMSGSGICNKFYGWFFCYE